MVGQLQGNLFGCSGEMNLFKGRLFQIIFMFIFFAHCCYLYQGQLVQYIGNLTVIIKQQKISYLLSLMIKDEPTLRYRFTGNIDYRNAKYQGEVQFRTSHCFGHLLDQNYTWVCSEWNNKNLGPLTAVIFSDSSKIFGQMLTQSKIYSCSNHQITVCQGEFYKIYIKNNVLVVDLQKYRDKNYHTLTKFIIHNIRDIQGQQQSSSKRMNLRESPNYKELNRFKKKLQYVCQIDYLKYSYPSSQMHCQRQYMKILSELIQNDLSINEINLDFFLRNKKPFCQYLSLHESVQEKGQQNHSLLTICLHEKQLSLQKIELKLFKQQENQRHRGTEKWKLLKMQCRSNNRTAEISKKYQYYANDQGFIAEQYVYDTDSQEKPIVVGYVQYEHFYAHSAKSSSFVDNFYLHSDKYCEGVLQLCSRPDEETKKKCLKNLNEHYKKSLNFSNQYINLTPVYTMQSYFIQLLKLALPIIQIQHINTKMFSGDQKYQEHENLNRKKFEKHYSRKQLRECSNIDRATVNSSRIGDYIINNINNLVQKNQYQVSIEDVKREILLTELKGSRRKSRIQTKMFRESDESEQKKSYTARKRKNDQVIQNNQDSHLNNQLYQGRFKQKSEKRKMENENQILRSEANILTGKIYSNSQALKLNKNKVGTYVYYFENDPKNMISNEETSRVNRYNIQRETISPTDEKFGVELFKSQLTNEKPGKPHIMNSDMQSREQNNDYKKQLEELAHYYQQIQSKIHVLKKSEELPTTEKPSSIKKTNKNSNKIVDKNSMKSSQKIQKNRNSMNSPKKRNKSKQSFNKAKESPFRKKQIAIKKSEQSEGELEQSFYKYPRQYPSEIPSSQNQQIYFENNFFNQQKQPSKIGNFFKYSPQKVNPKNKNSYLFGK